MQVTQAKINENVKLIYQRIENVCNHLHGDQCQEGLPEVTGSAQGKCRTETIKYDHIHTRRIIERSLNICPASEEALLTLVLLFGKGRGIGPIG